MFVYFDILSFIFRNINFWGDESLNCCVIIILFYFKKCCIIVESCEDL